MRSLVLITALSLCRLSWSSASQTLEVRLGEDVTLTCSNFSASSKLIEWFRVVDRSKPSCVSSMVEAHREASFCDGFQGGKFNMSSNISTIFLQIKGVDFSDTGLYFCGVYKKRHTILDCAVELTIKGNNGSNKKAHPDSGVLPKDRESYTVTYGCLMVFFLMAVGVVLKAKCPSKESKEKSPGRNKALGSSATLGFPPKTKGSKKPVEDRAMETHVIYAFIR
ncbi:uncharacterized protein ACNS7B_021567 [Menidia menidia]